MLQVNQTGVRKAAYSAGVLASNTAIAIATLTWTRAPTQEACFTNRDLYYAQWFRNYFSSGPWIVNVTGEIDQVDVNMVAGPYVYVVVERGGAVLTNVSVRAQDDGATDFWRAIMLPSPIQVVVGDAVTISHHLHGWTAYNSGTDTEANAIVSFSVMRWDPS